LHVRKEERKNGREKARKRKEIEENLSKEKGKERKVNRVKTERKDLTIHSHKQRKKENNSGSCI
jgi:hypothetical protein